MTHDSHNALIRAATAAWDKKAEDLVVLDLRGLSDIADYFIICHGSSDRHVQAIATNIENQLSKAPKLRPASVEGKLRSEWILIDYIDFIVHVFLDERRKFYRLERLWGDAPQIEIPQPERPVEGSTPAPATGEEAG